MRPGLGAKESGERGVRARLDTETETEKRQRNRKEREREREREREIGGFDTSNFNWI